MIRRTAKAYCDTVRESHQKNKETPKQQRGNLPRTKCTPLVKAFVYVSIISHIYVTRASNDAAGGMLPWGDDMQEFLPAVEDERRRRPAGGIGEADLRVHDGIVRDGGDCSLVGGLPPVGGAADCTLGE